MTMEMIVLSLMKEKKTDMQRGLDKQRKGEGGGLFTTNGLKHVVILSSPQLLPHGNINSYNTDCSLWTFKIVGY